MLKEQAAAVAISAFEQLHWFVLQTVTLYHLPAQSFQCLIHRDALEDHTET